MHGIEDLVAVSYEGVSMTNYCRFFTNITNWSQFPISSVAVTLEGLGGSVMGGVGVAVSWEGLGW